MLELRPGWYFTPPNGTAHYFDKQEDGIESKAVCGRTTVAEGIANFDVSASYKCGKCLNVLSFRPKAKGAE